jgi:hypothetical protein
MDWLDLGDPTVEPPVPSERFIEDPFIDRIIRKGIEDAPNT